MIKTLNKLNFLRLLILRVRVWYYTRVWGMDIDPTCQFSLTAKFDRTFPAGIHLGPESYVAFGAAILTHDRVRGLYLHTRVGARCFIGARSLILPGITIGDGSIVAAGSVVTRDVPAASIVAGNPARVIREGVQVGAYGRLAEADANEARCRAQSNFYD